MNAQKTRRAEIRPHRIELVLLAAGASRRMGGTDKLLRMIDGEPLIRRAARVALASRVDATIVVVPQGAVDRQDALAGLDVRIVTAKTGPPGMATSIRAGVKAVSPQCAVVVIALADMPAVTVEHIDLLIAAFDADNGTEICRAVSSDGRPGHPVLFSRRLFQKLISLEGDKGAKEVLSEVPDLVASVPTPGDGAVVDLDTPQDWADWLARRAD